MADDQDQSGTIPQIQLPQVDVIAGEQPPPVQSGNLQPGGAIHTALDSMTDARLQGYEWPEIDQHLAQVHDAAAQWGYTPQEVDQHLGYQDPQVTQDMLSAIARTNVVNNQTDHPLTAASGGVYDPKNDETGLAAGGAFDAVTRGIYSHALLNGHVKGPNDFTDAFQSATVDASGNPDFDGSASLGSPFLNAQLPDNKTVTDFAIGLGQRLGMDLDVDTVNNIKTNMMSAWTETGTPISSIYQQATENPTAAQALIAKPLDTFGPLPGELHLDPNLPAQGVTRPLAPGEYLKNPDGSWSNEMSWTVPVKGKPAVVPGLWLINGVPTHVGEDQASELAEHSGLKFPTFATADEADKFSEDRENAWQNKEAGDKSVPALWTGKIKNPQALPSSFAPSDAVYDPFGNMMTDPTGVVGQVKSLIHLPAAESQHLDMIKEMEAAKNPDGTPKYTPEQINMERMESPLLKTFASLLAFGAVGKVGGMAYGALTSGDMAATLKALAADESGSLKALTPGVVVGNNLQRMGMSAADYADWVKNKPGEYGEHLIREAMGLSQRDWEASSHFMEEYVKEMNQHIPEFERELAGPRGVNYNPVTGQWAPRSVIRNFMDNVEGKTGPGIQPIAPNSPMAPVLNGIKQLQTQAQTAIQNRITAGVIQNPMGFTIDKFAHMFTRPDVARQIFSNWRIPNAIPTMGDGIDAGLTPKILNPIESELYHWRGLQDFLNETDVRHYAQTNGVLKYDNHLRPGKSFLKGESARRSTVLPNGQTINMRAQAPHQFASAYNSWVDKGVYDWQTRKIGPLEIVPGKVYDKLQGAVNVANGLKLAISAYHFKNIAQEQLAAGMTQAFGELKTAVKTDSWDEFGRAMKSIGYTGSVLPRLAESHVLGRMGQRQYLGISDYGPEMEHVVDLLTRANYRFIGRRHFGGITSGIDVAQAGPLNNVFTALRKGSLALEQRQAVQRVAGLPGETLPTRIALAVPRAVELAAKELAFIGDSLNHPLFDHLIPMQKNAAAMNEVALYLRDHPNTTWEETIRATRQIVDSIDNRFGELNQDNLFWPRAMKQAFNLYTVSLGWELGTIRAIFGGSASIVHGAAQMFKGETPTAWGTNTRWLLGFPVAMAMSNAITQYLLSPTPVGQGGPVDLIKDLFLGGRTGGRNPDGTPERRLLPGYIKEFFDWAYDYQHTDNLLQAAALYAKGKANSGIQMAQSIFTGKKWFNWANVYNKTKPSTTDQEQWYNGLISHFFTETGTVAPQWLQYLRYAEEELAPIGVQVMKQGKPGSAIGTWGRLLGDKPVPSYMEKDVEPSSGGRGHTWTSPTPQELNAAKAAKKLRGVAE